jgi:hypothetical protein
MPAATPATAANQPQVVIKVPEQASFDQDFRPRLISSVAVHHLRFAASMAAGAGAANSDPLFPGEWKWSKPYRVLCLSDTLLPLAPPRRGPPLGTALNPEDTMPGSTFTPSRAPLEQKRALIKDITDAVRHFAAPIDAVICGDRGRRTRL